MSTKKIRKEIINIRGYKCEDCGLSEWKGERLPLELEHIDGDNTNDTFANVKLLCPNCHSLTKTWRRRKTSIGNPHVSDEEMLDALATTENIRQALLKIGLKAKGGNYRRAARLMNRAEKKVDYTNSQFGTMWIHDGKVNKKIKKDDLETYLGFGWYKGRLCINYTRPSHLNKNKMWITNGSENKFTSDPILPDGWWKGRVV